ncbi:acireductone dioxygenase [Azospirillum sp.]|uniref:1,2-dihydroxy-3-keto-5-methylthiopentene dioxygenase n=1 Tax=Azospirillum sp. TaxID=34012 RepID=UPI002D2C3EFA|nr:acireductone dioxygenase [Azospirillum sp.]HYD64904.1 acireductone dioxygenase [Azospirillum sp.]
MTALTVYWDTDAAVPELSSRDWLVVSAHLAHAGILFERWAVEPQLPADADAARVLAAYAAPIARLKASRGFRCADVVRVAPDTPGVDDLRRKFLSEHTHTEDEARFFVEGGGCFWLHLEDKVFRVACERGDMISIPAGTRHWFDMGNPPSFTAVRLFTRPDGWVADYTGDAIAGRFPRHEPA